MGNTTAPEPAPSNESDEYMNNYLTTSSASLAKSMGNTTASETNMRDPRGNRPQEMREFHLEGYRDCKSQELIPKVKRTLDLLHSNVDSCGDRTAENARRGVEESGGETVWCPVHGFEGVAAQSRCQLLRRADFDARKPDCDVRKPAGGLVSLQVDDVIPTHGPGNVRKPRFESQKPISGISSKPAAVNPLVHAATGTVYSTGGYIHKGVNQPNCDAQEFFILDTNSPTSNLQDKSARVVPTPNSSVVEKAECAVSRPKATVLQPIAVASTPKSNEVTEGNSLTEEEKEARKAVSKAKKSDDVTEGNSLTEEEKEARKAVSKANKKLAKAKTKVEGTLKGVGQEEKKLDETVEWMDKQKTKVEEEMKAHIRQLHANIDDHHQEARDAFNREQEKYWTRILEAKLEVQNYMSLLASMLAEIQDAIQDVKTRGASATASFPTFCSKLQARLAKTPEIKITRPTYSLYLPEVTEGDISSLVGSFRITENMPDKEPPPSQQNDAGSKKPAHTSEKGPTTGAQGENKKKEKTAPPNPVAVKNGEHSAGTTKKKGENPVGREKASVEPKSAPSPAPKEKVKSNSLVFSATGTVNSTGGSLHKGVKTTGAQPSQSLAKTGLPAGTQTVKKTGSTTASFSTQQKGPAVVTQVQSPVSEKKGLSKSKTAKPVPGGPAASKKASVPATVSTTLKQKVGLSLDVSYNSLLTKGLAASLLSGPSFVASDPSPIAFLSRASTNATIQAWVSGQEGEVESAQSNPDVSKGTANSTTVPPFVVSGKKTTSVATSELSAKQKQSTLMATAPVLSSKGVGNSSDSRGKPSVNPFVHPATVTGGCMNTGVNARSLSHDDIAVSLANKEKGTPLLQSVTSLDSLSASKGKRKRAKKKKNNKKKESPSSQPYSINVHTGSYPVRFQGRQKPGTGLAPRPDGKIWVVYGYRDPHLDLLDSDGLIVKSTRIGKNTLHASCFDREHVLVASRSPSSELRLFDSEGELTETIKEEILSSGLSVGNTGIIVSSDKALYWICLDGGESRYIVPEKQSSTYKFCSTAIVPHQGKEIVCAADKQGRAVYFWRREHNGEFVPLPPFTEENITSQDESKRESFVPVSISSHASGFLAILDVKENDSRVFIFNMSLHRPVRVIPGSQLCSGAVPSVLAFGAEGTEKCPTMWVATTTGPLIRTDLAFEYYA